MPGEQHASLLQAVLAPIQTWLRSCVRTVQQQGSHQPWPGSRNTHAAAALLPTTAAAAAAPQPHQAQGKSDGKGEGRQMRGGDVCVWGCTKKRPVTCHTQSTVTVCHSSVTCHCRKKRNGVVTFFLPCDRSSTSSAVATLMNNHERGILNRKWGDNDFAFLALVQPTLTPLFSRRARGRSLPSRQHRLLPQLPLRSTPHNWQNHRWFENYQHLMSQSSYINMLSLRSATSSLLVRSFATAAPKFDASKLNSFIKGSEAK